MPAARYDRIGLTYHRYRRPDPRISEPIQRAQGGARRVLNVGAGQGAYEPPGCVAVEPSWVMLGRRRGRLAPAVQAVAECLPFPDGAFDGAMAIFTVHHWSDPEAGLAEVQRVTAGPVAVLTWDADYFGRHFWLVRDYVPEAAQVDGSAPGVAWIASRLGPARVEVVPVPHDCTDGFSAAYWRRPEMYLDPGARAAISNLALLDPPVVERMAAALDSDLRSGAWRARYAELLDLEQLDCGYRLIIGSGTL